LEVETQPPYDAGKTAPQFVQRRIFFFITSSQPSSPPTKNATAKKNSTALAGDITDASESVNPAIRTIDKMQTIMPRIEGKRKMYPITTTGVLMRYFFSSRSEPTPQVLHLGND
jgi:hypothetical protein